MNLIVLSNADSRQTSCGFVSTIVKREVLSVYASDLGVTLDILNRIKSIL